MLYPLATLIQVTLMHVSLRSLPVRRSGSLFLNACYIKENLTWYLFEKCEENVNNFEKKNSSLCKPNTYKVD